MPANKIRIHELALELGMTNAEVLLLCSELGVRAKGPSSSLVDAYADKVRSRADREGLTRPAPPSIADIPPPTTTVFELTQELDNSVQDILRVCADNSIPVQDRGLRMAVADGERVRRLLVSPESEATETRPPHDSDESAADSRTNSPDDAAEFDLLADETVCAIVGLAVVTGGRTGRIETVDQSGVLIRTTSGARRVAFGSHLETEGGRRGPLRAPPKNPAQVPAILAEDRSRTIGRQLIGDRWVSHQLVRESLGIVAELLDEPTPQGILELLPGLDDAEHEVAAAMANCFRIGPTKIPVPTPARLLTVAPSIGWLRHGLRHELDGDQLREIVATGVEPDQLAGWRGDELAPIEIVEWVLAGYQDYRSASAWVAERLGPREAGPWRRAGYDAAGSWPWRDAGIEPSNARDWEAAGYPIEAAAEWNDYGLTAGETTAWVAAGISVPRLAAALTRHGVPTREAAELLAEGLPLATAARWMLSDIDRAASTWADRHDWIGHGVSPDVAQAWEGVPVAIAVSLAESDVAPETIRSWTRRGLDPEDATTLIKSGIDPTELEQWVRARVAAAAVEPWRDAGFSPHRAKDWMKLGEQNPVEAQTLARVYQPADVEMLLEAGIELPTLHKWVRRSSAASESRAVLQALNTRRKVGRWTNSGLPTRDWPAWVQVLPTSPDVAGQLSRRRISPQEISRLFDDGGLRRKNLSAWLDTGLSLDEIMQAQQRGESPDDHVAAPFPDFVEWRRQGKPWITGSWLDSRRSLDREFLRRLHERELRWAEPSTYLFDDRATDDWLEEVLARAENLSPQISKQLSWPATFESQRAEIVLAETSRGMAAWVGRRGAGIVVSFDPTTFDIAITDDPDARLAVGLAISWFIDCCITIPMSSRTHPELGAEATAPTPGRRTPSDRDVVYKPRPSMERRLARGGAGGGTVPRAHRVTGFIRRLPRGWNPTDEARSRAPAYLRHRMGPHDTFVRDHVRGGEERRRELIVRLSKYSSLGDSLKLLPRSLPQRSPMQVPMAQIGEASRTVATTRVRTRRPDRGQEMSVVKPQFDLPQR